MAWRLTLKYQQKRWRADGGRQLVRTKGGKKEHNLINLLSVGVGGRPMHFSEVMCVARWVENMQSVLEPTHNSIFVYLKTEYKIQKRKIN